MLTILSRIACIALFIGISSPLFSQSIFQHSPAGKQYFERSNEQLLIKFVKGTSFEEQAQLLAATEAVAPLAENQLLPSPVVTLASLRKNLSTAEVDELLKQLRTLPQVIYVNPVVLYTDGTKQALQDELIVKLRQPADLTRLRSMAERMNVSVLNENEFERGLWHLRVNSQSTGDALQVANQLHESGMFEYTEPDWLRFMKPRSTNDTYLGHQWSLDNTGSGVQYNGTAGNDMSVFDAWNISTGSSSIKVAIIDEGVDLNHPDLAANMLGGYDATGQGSGGDPSGDDAHGTACAGIVAAVGNNSLGTVGIAYDAKIVPVRIAYSNASGDWVTSNTWIANALNWSWQTAGADVLSNSWGGGSYSSTIVNAINGSINSGRGGLGAPVLFAAGNDNTSLDFPGNQAPTIAVGAMSMCAERKNPSSCDGESWWGSNFGTGLDIAAPGVKIATSDISGSAGYSSGDYALTFNGTSSACPNAAGVMALILSVNPSLTEAQARDAIETSCDKVGGYTYNSNVSGQPNGTWSNDLGYGRVNAYAAVLSVQTGVADDAGISAISAPTASVCASSISPVVTLRNFGSNALTSATINYQVDGGTTFVYNWTGNLASNATTTVNLLSIAVGSGSHTFTAYTSNPNGNADGDPSNDQSQANFSSGTNGVTLTLTFDDYAAETSWEVRNSSGTVVASFGPYQASQSTTTVIENICLADGCYDFTINDAYGDGICCTYGNGSYTLREDATNTVLASGATFTSSETTNFCVPVNAGPPVAASISSSSNVSCNGGSNGSIAVTATDGTTPYTYAWNNGASTAGQSGIAAGIYVVTVTDATGGTATASATISQPSALALSNSASNANCNGGSDGTIDLTVSGGTAPYAYNWSNGATSQDVVGLSAGSYTVTVTDDNNCTATQSASISQPSAVSVSMSATDATTQGGNEGTATAAASGGTAPYVYNWSNGSTVASIIGLTAGTYTVTVSDNNNCTATNSVVVNDGAAGGGCAVSVAIPYNEGFETSLGDWTQNSGDDLDWTRQTGSTGSSNTGPGSAASGSYYLYVEASSPNYPAKTTIITGPCFDLTSASNPELTFDYHMYGAAMGTLSLEASTNGGTTWSSAIWSLTGDQGNAWNGATVDLSSYAGATVALRFVGVTGTSWTSDMSIDNLNIEEPSSVTYCASNGQDASYEWIESVSIGNLSNTSGGNGGYADFTAQSASLTVGGNASVTLTPGFSGSTYVEFWRIWIDFNKDGDFTDANEEVFAPASSSSAVSGSFTVPGGVATGTTTMRVSMKWNAAQTSCESFSYGEVEDYTVVIGSAAKPESDAMTSAAFAAKTTLFPNPANNYVNIRLDAPVDEAVVINVFDLAGNVVAVDQISPAAAGRQLNVEHLAAGAYYVQLRAASFSATKRLVIAE